MSSRSSPDEKLVSIKIIDPSVLRYYRLVDLHLIFGDNHIYQCSCRIRTDILPVLQCYEPNDEDYRLSNHYLKRNLDVFFGGNQIWERFLWALAISPFPERLTLHSIGVFSSLIRHGAQSSPLNALRHLEFWKDFPEQLMRYLQGRWQVEVSDQQFWQWLSPEICDRKALF